MSNHQQQIVLQEELEAASSVATFESSSTETFRQELRRCLSRIVTGASSTTDSGILRYDPSQFSRYLITGIDWKTQCRHHDRTKEKFRATPTASNNKDKLAFSSPLQELVNLLLDPRVVPSVLAPPLLQVFARAFLLHSSSASSLSSSLVPAGGLFTTRRSWNPSQSILLKAVRCVMTSRQYRDDFGTILHTIYTTDFPKGDPTFRIRQSALSLTEYCMTEFESIRSEFCPIVAMFPCLLKFLQSMLLEERIPLDGSSVPNRHYCPACGINKELRLLAERRLLAETRKKRKVGANDLGVLHGEVDDADDEDNNKLQHGTQSVKRPDPQRPVTLKSMMRAKICESTSQQSFTSCPNCQHVPKPHDTGNIIPDEDTIQAWCHLRDQYIHSMISSFQSTKFLPQRRPYRVLHTVLVVARYSPYLRVCALQLADMLEVRGYKYLISCLWNLVQENDPQYITWYAEFIVESSFCDKREQCWEAMQPLVEHVRAQCQDDDTQDEPALDCDTRFIPCLGYIFSRRGRLLQSITDDISQDFASLVAGLSWAFGEVKDWIPPAVEGIDGPTEQQILGALESLGILSPLSLLQDESEKSEDIVCSSNNSTKPRLPILMIPDPTNLRRAYQRMTSSPLTSPGISHQHDSGPKYVLNRHLLSNPKHDQKQILPSEMVTRVKEVVTPTIPLLNYLDDDVLRNIFSFLGYKKLSKVRAVCSIWKTLSDEDRFWFPLYRRRYGLLGYDESEAKETKVCEITTVAAAPPLWKSRFAKKWYAQRGIRFKRNEKQDFKHIICGYLHCHCALHSPVHVKNHYAKHEKEKARQLKKEAKRKAQEIAKDANAAKKVANGAKKRKRSPAVSTQEKAKKLATKPRSPKPKIAKPASKTATAKMVAKVASAT